VIIGFMLLLPSLALAGITLISDAPVSNSVTNQMYQYNQNAIYWAVTGVRPEQGTDWDIYLYTDTLCLNPVSYSLQIGSAVDFVLADYNHSPVGWEGVKVNRYSGSGNCLIEYDDGPEWLSTPSINNLTWPAGHVVQCWDIYLTEGQSFKYSINPLNSALDFGIALFQSNGSSYYTGKGNATISSDYGPAGFAESFNFTAPVSDYYGLVIWSNNEAGGDYNIAIENLPTLYSDVPLYHSQDLPWYYKASINHPYWYAAGARPNQGGISYVWYTPDTTFNVYAASSLYGMDTVNFVVADGNHLPFNNYGVASYATSNFVPYKLEFESEVSVLSLTQPNGPFDWPAGHVAHAWDVWLNAGQTVTFTLGNVNGNVDLNLSLFSSADGPIYFSRSQAAAGAAQRGPGLGETFTYTPSASDYYGLVVWAQNNEGGTFTIDITQLIQLMPETPFANSRIDQDYKIYTNHIYWAGVAVRPETGSDWDIMLYDDTLNTNLLASSVYAGSMVDFVVGDFNHSPLGWKGVNVQRYDGTGNCAVEYVDSTNMLPTGHFQINWQPGHIIKIWDIYLTQGRRLNLMAIPSASQDIGLAIFNSNGAAYYAGRNSAIQADNYGLGGAENISFMAPATDYYGLVMWSNSGDGLISVDALTGIEDAANLIPAQYALAQNYPNPFNAQTKIAYSLAQRGAVSIDIYDILGRRISQLSEGIQEPGNHDIIWDANAVPTGIYFYRLTAGEYQETKRMMLLK
jgi:hypothetical protein